MSFLHISSAFDSGAIDVVSLAGPADIQVRIRADNASDFAQWFHFALYGAAQQAVTVRFLNAGATAYPKGWEGYCVVASHDRLNWFRIPTVFDGAVMTAQVTPEANCIYFAYFEPYSHERHLDLLGSAAVSEHVQVERLGATPDGRDMTLLHITGRHSGVPLAQRTKLWVIARQHPGESMAEWFVEGLLERLLDTDDSLSSALLENCQFFVVPNMNPDGSVRGNLRTNALGANLNREWLQPSETRSPEVYCVRRKMLEVGVDFCLDVHGDEGLPYNFVVGTEGTPGYSPHVAASEVRFKAHWEAVCPDFQTAVGYHKTQAEQANLSLATNWVGNQFACLAFTVEMPFKDNANLPNAATGWSGKRSKALGASVLQPIWALVDRLR